MPRQESLNRSILRIAIPAIVSNITTPVLGLVDVALVGHFGAAAYIGAIALGGTMFNMLYWLFGFLRMGTAGITAQAFGAADRTAQSAALRRSLLLALGGALPLIGLSAILAPALLSFLDAGDAVQPAALRYFGICIWGAPAVLGLYTLNGWWLGMQDSRTPMWVALGVNVANIAISLTLVLGAGWRIEGVAAGTLGAQWLGFLAGLAVTARRYRPVRVSVRQLFHRADMHRMLTVNADIFLRTLCLVAVTVWFTRTGASQGVEILAANALLMQFFMFFSYFSDGFAFAGEALAGRFAGASDHSSLHTATRRLLRWGWGIAACFTILYFTGGQAILHLLTSERQVAAAAAEYLPWAVSIPALGIAAFIYDGIFVGTTRTRRMLVAMLAATAVYFAAWLALMPALGNHGLWLAFALYLATRSAAMHFLRPR